MPQVRQPPPKAPAVVKERRTTTLDGRCRPTDLEIREGAALLAYIKRPLNALIQKAFTTLTCELHFVDGIVPISRCPICCVCRYGNAGDCVNCNAPRPSISMTAREMMTEDMREAQKFTSRP